MPDTIGKMVPSVSTQDGLYRPEEAHDRLGKMLEAFWPGLSAHVSCKERAKLISAALGNFDYLCMVQEAGLEKAAVIRPVIRAILVAKQKSEHSRTVCIGVQHPHRRSTHIFHVDQAQH